MAKKKKPAELDASTSDLFETATNDRVLDETENEKLNRSLELFDGKTLAKEFKDTIATVRKALGPKAFRVGSSLNAAIFDAVMVGVARRLKKAPITNGEALADAYNILLANKGFGAAYVRATSDEESVRSRLAIARKAFAKVP